MIAVTKNTDDTSLKNRNEGCSLRINGQNKWLFHYLTASLGKK